MTKRCGKCRVGLPLSGFYKANHGDANGLEWECKSCHKYRESNRRWQQRVETIARYSTSRCCQKCGYNDLRALVFDHVNGDGAAHRKLARGTGIISWLRKHNFPTGFQVLCHNCNFIKRLENKEHGNKQPRLKP